MGMFDSFLGQNTGYTGAQKTGLRRSAEIKKKRKEEERAFKRKQEKSKTEAALVERSIMEAGETRRAGMGVAGGIEEQRVADVGMMARQKLTGEQEREAATVKATREAGAASMKYARKKTLTEIESPGEKRLFTAYTGEPGTFDVKTGETQRLTLPPIGERARAGLGQPLKREGGAGSILTKFLDMDNSTKRIYMKRLQKEDPDEYLKLAKQVELYYKPKKEESNYESGGGLGGRSIYRSEGGTYRNF